MKALVLAALCGSALFQPASLLGQSRAQRDQALLTQLTHSSPCPKQVPAAWLRPDSTLGHSIFCPVVAAAAAKLAASPDSLDRWIVANAHCTVFSDLVASQPPDTTTGAGWHVTFVADSTRMTTVHFNRQTGAVSTGGFGLLGNQSRPRNPPCQSGA